MLWTKQSKTLVTNISYLNPKEKVNISSLPWIPPGTRHQLGRPMYIHGYQTRSRNPSQAIVAFFCFASTSPYNSKAVEGFERDELQGILVASQNENTKQSISLEAMETAQVQIFYTFLTKKNIYPKKRRS